MPPLPGEERVLTVFADIHYYFVAPTPKALHHRFDKGSYLYIYQDASQHKIRIEVANNPGTPDQDAFNGGLDHVHLRHASNFPTRCTLTVDGQTQNSLAFPPPPSTNFYDWKLPLPSNGAGLHCLHTLDIYFWTLDDVNQFLDLAERHLPHSQIETDRHQFPAPAGNNTISTVVQNLENVAITDPGYQNGQTRNSQSQISTNSASLNIAAPSAVSPPLLAGAQQTTTKGNVPADEQKGAAQFTPMPYNPAAPAAPEPIQYREKTPPPEDSADGTGLAAAMAADNGVPFTPPSQISGGSFAPPPRYTLHESYTSPPPSSMLIHSNSFSSPHSTIQTPPSVPSYTPAFLAGGQQPVNQAGMMSFAPPPKDPNAHLYGQNLYGSPPPPQQQQPQVQHNPHQPPVGGYSNYSYPPASAPAPPSNDYSMHSQLYRPTEAEAGSHSQKMAQKAMQNPGQRNHKLEDSASRIEGSVNKFLKKLEKRL